MQMQVAVSHLWFQPAGLPFILCCRHADGSFSFCLPEKSSPLVWGIVFLNVELSNHPFQYLNMPSHYLLASMVPVRSRCNLTEDPLDMSSFFFKIDISGFSQFHDISRCRYPWVYPTCSSLNFFDMQINFLSNFRSLRSYFVKTPSLLSPHCSTPITQIIVCFKLSHQSVTMFLLLSLPLTSPNSVLAFSNSFLFQFKYSAELL
jgi:hypothetical protein